ncbi:hypothetical protein FNV43_RR04112 [Rhamnella rubrinervis]|uniref:Uncharacterized protein n=1 Tax=Rhamnella rubrinervis TaxID=2594499 RepID=A0A8K0HJL7_9ROSA|nr:hypothetical protein FNV43_RR04112 [Rhamnella rubrinervis]
MTEFQRSTTSFRRQGSSGLVWDDKYITEGNNKPVESRDREPRPSSMDRSRSTGSTGRAYRTLKVSPPTADPPSPKVSGCGLCGIFGKPVAAHNPKSKKRSKT